MMIEKIKMDMNTMLGIFHAEKKTDEGAIITVQGKFPNASETARPVVAIDFEKDPLHARKVEFLDEGKDQDRDEREEEWNECKERWDTDSLLGTYKPETSLITLYAKSIATAATDLNVDANQLAEVVLLHELGHWASHRVKDNDGKDWDSHKVKDDKGNVRRDFADAKEEITERWAQVLAYWAIKKTGEASEKLIDVFDALTGKQRDVYKLKKKSEERKIIDGNDPVQMTLLLNELVYSRKGGSAEVGQASESKYKEARTKAMHDKVTGNLKKSGVIDENEESKSPTPSNRF